MADEAAKIAVAVEVQLDQLRTGLASAQTQIANSSRQMEASLKTIASKPAEEMEKFAKRANVLLGVQGAVGALRLANVATAAMRGDFDEMQRSIESLPMGLGAVAQAFHGIAAEIVGLNDSLERLARANREAAAAWQAVSIRTSFADNLAAARAEIGIMSERDPEQQARLQFEEDMRRIDADLRNVQREAANRGVLVTDAAIQEQREARIMVSERRMWERIRKIREDAERKAADDAVRANAVAAELIERNRRDARQRQYRETLDAIERETKERQRQQDELNKQLAEAQGVVGANFVSTVSSGFGQFRVGQVGGAQEVARAQIRSAQLLAKIAENTKAMAALADERDFVSSLR